MRFRKGTTDHDNDGKMGGSMKETDMTKTTKPAAKPATTAEPKAAVESSTTQSGMEPGPSPKDERARLNEQFAKADEKGQAAIIDETQVGLQVRGY